MPIKIDYSPTGALLGLAGLAGQAERKRNAFAQDMQLLEFSQRQQEFQAQREAQDKSFELQRVMAERTLAAQMRTPAADHIKERADLEAATRNKHQTDVKAQLDSMKEKGAIDEAQYQKGLLAVMTGNEPLMQHILATPPAVKPNISNSQTVDTIREPFRERRRMLEGQLGQVTKTIAEGLFGPGDKEAAQKQQSDLMAQIDAQFAQETAALEQFRQHGQGGVAAPAEDDAGIGSISYTPALSTSEHNILSMARWMGGPEVAAKIGGDRPVTQTLGTKPLDQATAQQILQEAGGDKERARQIARDRGYTF
jgi:hypothetical protein